ncbi:NAD/nadp octopine/nopaline dehydrogenase [Peptoniphilus sp. ING2-D1G]|nr:NAD/nadp octopine/nopaline dehydrogenase [Peptoniphilus sp. ING2-D1G]
MKFTIIGAGNTGIAMAGHLTTLNQKFRLYDRNKDKVEKIKKEGIVVKGVLEVETPVEITNDIKEAIKDTNYIMVMTTANGHRDIGAQIAKYVRDDQVILIFNGNWGAVEIKEELNKAGKDKTVVAETGAQIYISDHIEQGQVELLTIKKAIDVASIPSGAVNKLIEDLKDIYPQFSAVSNVLETSINNSNPTYHLPIVLFNAARIDAKQPFKFYGEGASERVVRYTEKIDEERLEICDKLGIKGVGALDIINSFWDVKYDSIYDTMHLNPVYSTGNAPLTFEHRYLSEDLPYGIGSLVKLARKYGIKVPYLENLVTSLSLFLDEDFLKIGPDFKNFQAEDYL